MRTSGVSLTLFGILLAWLLYGCGGREPGLTAHTLEAGNPGIQAAASAWPAALPADRVQPWEEVSATGRVATAINPQSEFCPGVDRYSDSGASVVDHGEAASLHSGSAGSKQTGWAIYRLALDGVQPGAVSADVNLLAADGGGASGYYLGLANYARGCWEWHGPFSDSHVRLGTAQQAAAGADYLSPLGNLFICVAAYDGARCDVVALAANPLDSADATAPPVPTGLSVVARSGALELQWNTVAAGDLAGYRVYYSSAAFEQASAAGVRSLPYLLGQAHYVLAGLSARTHVRVAAVDFSGNESGLSDAASALPLTGTSPSVLLTASTPSGMLHDAIMLAASGGDSYDFDLDGDGIYDITGTAEAMQSVDTGATGIIRPAVRATQGGGTAVACGAVSLLIASNSRPVAVAKALPASGTAPLEVTFSGTQSTDFDGTVVGGGWDFDGDGTYDVWDATSLVHVTSAQHVYSTAGVYNAKLKVVDNQGAWDVDTVTVVVNASAPENDAPVAALAVDQDRPRTGQMVTFDASGSTDPDGSIVLYEWDFDGDGAWDANGAAATARHSYAVQFSYMAQVRVTDNLGAQDTSQLQLAAAHGPWTARGHDTLHSGRSPYVGAQTNTLKWSYTTGDMVYSSPAIGADGTVYVGSDDKKLYAINPGGTLKWSYTTGGMVYSSPAIGADGTVYVGSDDNKLYAINPDGSLKWSYSTESDVRSSPAIGADGTVYVGGNDSKLYAINPDGSLKWSYSAGFFVESSPAIGADGTVYVGSDDGRLYAINPDGSLKWSYMTGGMVYSSPAIGADGTVYVGCDDYKLYAINPDGSLKWSYSTGGSVYSSPATGADGTVYVGSDDYKLYAINPDGSLKWTYTAGFCVESSPAIGADGTVYVGSRDNKFYALNPGGTLKWAYTTGFEVRSSPAIGANGTVYVGSDDRKLYAIGP